MTLPESPGPNASAPAIPPHAIPTTQDPPRSLGGILLKLGPGLIIAGSIVGSGELIGTTETGARAGFTLLWLILVGCVIKVFVQIEIGRYTLSAGRTPMEALNDVPGPRWRVNWLVWYWLVMFTTCSIGQLGGILGGSGQALALAFPITGDFRAAVTAAEAVSIAGTWDDVTWSAIVAVLTAVLLVNGRYGVIQHVATALVASFTVLTVANVLALPVVADIDIVSGVAEGLRFQLPPPAKDGGPSPLLAALATFGIIGVGSMELITYPYWCLEKGYARYTGPRDATPAWGERARGWMRVMQWDAWCSMVVYTLATVAFYILGAGVLHPRGLTPAKDQMMPTLAKMYQDVFGPWGDALFLFGALAVLYSTTFVATAGNSRMAVDGLTTFGLFRGDESAHRRAIRWFCVIFPALQLAVYCSWKNPVGLVLLAGMTQHLMLPMLAVAAIYYRYGRCDPRIKPGPLWDACLVVSVIGLIVAGAYGAWASWGSIATLLAPLTAGG